MMNSELILILITLLSYSGAILTQRSYLRHRSDILNWLTNGCALIALCTHGILLHRWIDTATGQNLTLFNLLSLVAWCTGVITAIIGFIKPMGYLKIIIFTLAIISSLLVILFPGNVIIETSNNPRQLLHILISTAAMSVFYLAGIQALLLSIQEYRLHHRQLTGVIGTMPSLETMEIILFQILTVGFVLLSSLLLTSIWCYHDQLSPSLLQKSFISFIAWSIFAILFIGRVRYGWRGQVVTRWTLGGVILITVIYFSSQLFFLT